MAEPQKVIPFRIASGGKKQWPSLCQKRSETYVPANGPGDKQCWNFWKGMIDKSLPAKKEIVWGCLGMFGDVWGHFNMRCIPPGCQRTAIWSKLAPAKDITAICYGFCLILWGRQTPYHWSGKTHSMNLHQLCPIFAISSRETNRWSSFLLQKCWIYIYIGSNSISQDINPYHLPTLFSKCWKQQQGSKRRCMVAGCPWCIKLSQMDRFWGLEGNIRCAKYA